MTRSTPSCATRKRRQRLRGVLDRIAVARADAASGAAPPRAVGRTARCARVGIRRIRPLLPRGDAGRPAFGAQRVPGSPVTGAYGDVPAVALWVSFLTRDTDLTPARLDAISSSHKESPREVHLTVCRCGTTPGGPRRHLRRGKAGGVQTGSGRGCVSDLLQSRGKPAQGSPHSPRAVQLPGIPPRNATETSRTRRRNIPVAPFS